MTNFETIIDFGSKNLRLGIFDLKSKNIYSSEQKIIDSSEKSLNILIKDAEKYLSKHIENIVVLYDSPKFYSLDVTIKKTFDYDISIKNVYNSLIDEAHFIVSQNNFKDQIIHIVVNNIFIDDNKKLNKIIDDIKIKTLILEIKFICLSKIILDEISSKFKNNNLKIINLYCSSYVKTINYMKRLDHKDCIFFLDIGFERSSSLIFNMNKFDFFKSIPLGGNNVTKDISKVLKLDPEYSEELKIKFNKLESELTFNKSDRNEINLYSEILEKKISIELLKQVIEARLDEIIELLLFKTSYIKNLNDKIKPRLVIFGNGTRLLSNNYNVSVKKIFSEIFVVDENDTNVCKSGLNYHKSDESLLNKTKKKPQKIGFFETFFNLFSK